MPTPDIVSILFYSVQNEFQICSYSEFGDKLNKFIWPKYIVMEAIHKYNPCNIKLVIEISQYMWWRSIFMGYTTWL